MLFLSNGYIMKLCSHKEMLFLVSNDFVYTPRKEHSMLLLITENIISLLFGLVLIIIASYFRKHYYTEIGSKGISLPSGKKSICNWLYAQIIGPRILLRYGMATFLITLFVNAFLMLFKLWDENSVYIGIIVGGIFLFISLYSIEKKCSSFCPSWLKNDDIQKKEEWIAAVLDSIHNKQYSHLDNLADETV